MNERDLREAVEAVRAGTLPRRRFVQRLAALGIGAPLAGWDIALAALHDWYRET